MTEYGHGEKMLLKAYEQAIANSVGLDPVVEGLTSSQFVANTRWEIIEEIAAGLAPLTLFNSIMDHNDFYDEDPFVRLGGWRE